MVRPRAGDFVYDVAEFERMQAEIAALRRLRVSAVVLGVLRADRTIDVVRTRDLVALARPLSVTFHRAFDDTGDKLNALDELISIGVERVLTSAGESTAHSGRAALAALVARASGRITILAGGGVREHNWRELVRDSGVGEIHSSTVFQASE